MVTALSFIEQTSRSHNPTTDSLEVRFCPNKGRGVFAKRFFAKGELIERAPVIVIPAAEEPKPDTTCYSYTHSWGEQSEQSALALGYGSLYNHSYLPNAYYTKEEESLCLIFLAYRDIACGEEILINYNKDPLNKDPLWFTVIE